MAFVNHTDKASFHIHSRHGQFIKDFPDDRFAGFFPGPGFTGDGDAWRRVCRKVARGSVFSTTKIIIP
jgi:hypothetical protein